MIKHATYKSRDGSEEDSACEHDAPGVWVNDIDDVNCVDCMKILKEHGVLWS